MRMRPILMSAPMVLATQADTKTVTRRLNGLEEVNLEPNVWELDDFVHVTGSGRTPYLEARFKADGQPTKFITCPYGVPGDGLWVRENFRLDRRCDGIPPSCALPDTRVWFEADGEKPDWAGRLRPSIHIPRWVSRLDLEEGIIFPQRLAKMTERDAQREGVQRGELHFDGQTKFVESASGKYLAGFRYLWDGLNPGHTFHRNPWVWVINFKRLIPFK